MKTNENERTSDTREDFRDEALLRVALGAESLTRDEEGGTVGGMLEPTEDDMRGEIVIGGQ